jgi:Uncharacterized lipoprotein
MKHILLGIGALFLFSCAPSLDPLIEIPEVPSVKNTSLSSLSRAVSVSPAIDLREESNDPEMTEPDSQAARKLEDALIESLTSSGVSVAPNSSIVILPKIKTWRSKIQIKDTGTISSEAAIEVEISTSSGKKIYSGNYAGNRQSQFPLINKADVQDSLGYAMQSALEQFLKDGKVVAVLR